MTTPAELAIIRRRESSQAFARGMDSFVQSGIPQEFLRGSFNFLSSLAQAGASSPPIATGTMALAAGMARRVGLIGLPTQVLIDTMAGAYLGGTVTSGIIDSIVPGGGPGFPTANQAFDLPDIAVSRGRAQPLGAPQLGPFFPAAGGGLLGGAAGGLLGAGAGAGAAGALGVRGTTVSPIVIDPITAQKQIDSQTQAFEDAGLLTPEEAQRVRDRGPGIFGIFGK